VALFQALIRLRSRVGIIVNPESGRDVRRLVSQASVFSNEEKTNILSRVILALNSVGVDEILLMRDSHNLGEKSLDNINRSLICDVSFVELNPKGSYEDTLEATKMIRRQAVQCLITIGGDGTNRLVAKESESIPILPISTGTNNVFPFMVEGTIAGLAAGAIATGCVNKEETSLRTKRCEILIDRKIHEIALIDATVTTKQFVGTGAVWEIDQVQEIVTTQGSPANIGMSSIAGSIVYISQQDDKGIYIQLGKGGRKVISAIAPGMLVDVDVKSFRILELDEDVRVKTQPSVIALDGERLIEIDKAEDIHIRVTRRGPLRVDIETTLLKAAERGFFKRRLAR
jgi:predicted polyphosphate/ATP-dependent NAD kinase